jgi:hypothetical protein
MVDAVITFRAAKRQRRISRDLVSDKETEATLPVELPQISEEDHKDTIIYSAGRLDTPTMDPPMAPGGASASPASASPPPSVDLAGVAYWAAVDQEQLLVEESDGEDDHDEAS